MICAYFVCFFCGCLCTYCAIVLKDCFSCVSGLMHSAPWQHLRGSKMHTRMHDALRLHDRFTFSLTQNDTCIHHVAVTHVTHCQRLPATGHSRHKQVTRLPCLTLSMTPILIKRCQQCVHDKHGILQAKWFTATMHVNNNNEANADWKKEGRRS